MRHAFCRAPRVLKAEHGSLKTMNNSFTHGFGALALLAGLALTSAAPVLAARTNDGSPAAMRQGNLATEPNSMQLSAATYSVDEHAGTATITVTRQGGANSSASVTYAASTFAAEANVDFTPVSGTLTFGPGETVKTFTVPIIDDMLDEDDERVLITLSNPTDGATLGEPHSALLSIVDDDPEPVVSIGDARVSEGVAGGELSFPVTISNPSGRGAGVEVVFEDGTAKLPQDYLPCNGLIEFRPGETSRTISVPIINDALHELDETIHVRLQNPISGALIGNGTATITITDDDPAPALSVSDVQVTSSMTTTKEATFAVALSAASGVTTTVDISTADGSAKAGSGYTATNATLTFAPGETTKTFRVPVLPTTQQGQTSFMVNLSKPSNATIAHGQGVATIHQTGVTVFIPLIVQSYLSH